MSEDVGQELSALQYNMQRLEDWVSPITPFEFEVSRPAEECAERLLHQERTGLKTLYSGITFAPDVVPDGEGGYHFFVAQNGVDNLRSRGLLINTSAHSTSVEGIVFPSLHRSVTDLGLLGLFFAIVGGVLGAIVHPAVGIMLAPIVLLLNFPVVGLMFRRYALNKQREFVSLITMALMLDAHSGSQMKKRK
jgi:hypothetical protein